MLRHLPADSSTGRAVHPPDGYPVWSVGDVLLAHVWQVLARSKKPHPMLQAEITRATPVAPVTPERAKALREVRQKALDRSGDINAGLIT